MRSTVGFLILCAGACGSVSSGDDEPYQSGARLRGHFQESERTRRWLGWHDSMFDVSCWFQKDRDGAVRCLPGESYSGYTFSDPACQQTVVEGYCGATPTYTLGGTIDDGDGCGGGNGSHVYLVGAPITPTELFVRDGMGACVSSGPPVENVIYYARGAEVPPDMFVPAEDTIDERDETLGVRIHEGEDGSRETFGLADTVRGAGCHPHLVDATTWRCLPEYNLYAYTGGYYADMSCQQPLAFTYEGPTCALSPIGIRFESSGQQCSTISVTAFEPGAEVPSTDAFASNGDTCVAYMGGEDLRTFQIGAPVPIETFPAVARGYDGEGRLQVGVYLDAEGEPLLPGFDGGFHDRTLGKTCSAVSLGGAMICLPWDTINLDDTGAGVFADATCTQELAVVTSDPCNPGVTPSHAARYHFAPCGTELLQVLALGERVTGPTVWLRSSDVGCVEAPADPNVSYYRVGAEVAPGDLPAVTDYIE